MIVEDCEESEECFIQGTLKKRLVSKLMVLKELNHVDVHVCLLTEACRI